MKLGDLLDMSPSGGQPAGAEPTKVPPTTQPPQQAPNTMFDPAMLEQLKNIPTPGEQQQPSLAPPPAPPAEAQSPTGGERSWLDSVLEFGFATNPVTATMTAIDRIGEAVADPGQDSGETFSGSFMDHATLGTFDAVAAAQEATKQWVTEGADWSETYANTKDAINAGLAENRASERGMAMAGALTGGAASLAAPVFGWVDKAVRGGKLFFTGLRAPAVGASAGGLEAAAYRYNSDGTKEEVIRDASYGALFGAAFGSIAGILPNTPLRRFLGGGGTSTETEKEAAQQLLTAINSKVTKQGEPPMTPEQMTQLFKDRGAEAVMADFYPDLLPYLRTTMLVPGTEGFARANALLAARNNAEAFSDVVDELWTVPGSRNLAQFKDNMAQLQKSASPKYNAVLDAADASGINFKVTGLRTSIGNMVEDMAGDIGQKREAMASFRDIIQKKATGVRVREGKIVDFGKVNMRALHNAKQEFYRKNKNNPAAKAIYDQINDWLGSVDPKYTQLTRTYSNNIDMEKAYNTGFKYMTGKKSTVDDIMDFAGSLGTRGEYNAFVNGMRRKLADDLRGKSPDAVKKFLFENTQKINMMRAVIGEDQTNKLLGATVAEAAGETTRRAMESMREGVRTAKIAPENIRDKVDAAITAFGSGASPGRIRAVLQTFLPKDPNKVKNASSIFGEMAAAPLEKQPELMAELLKMSRVGRPTGAITRQGMAGLSAGGMTTEAANALENFDPEAEAEKITRYLGGLPGLGQ